MKDFTFKVKDGWVTKQVERDGVDSDCAEAISPRVVDIIERMKLATGKAPGQFVDTLGRQLRLQDALAQALMEYNERTGEAPLVKPEARHG